MAINFAILITVCAAALLLLQPRLYRAQNWRAMVTPLASIIGSGFLVLGPILQDAYGVYGPLVMAGLCGTAYLYGHAIRFNITHEARGAKDDGAAPRPLAAGLERASAWALAGAYVISVAYYLNLFGAFGVSLTAYNTPLGAKSLTSAMLLLILVVGWTRGFRLLERMEYLSVTFKLAIIAGLLAGLACVFGANLTSGTLLQPSPRIGAWDGLTLAFGLIVTVQGFETSRYLGDSYDAATRVRSMRIAQWISSGIYLTYISMLSFVIAPTSQALSETSIIHMMGSVSPILPALLVAAALSAQFSAAVADTSGAGGLFNEASGRRLSARQAYALVVAAGLLLTWQAHVFEIISYASRAFALYYALQSAIAALGAQLITGQRVWTGIYLLLSVLGVAIVVSGQLVA